MRFSSLLFILSLCLSTSFSVTISKITANEIDPTTALEIMRRVANRDLGDNSVSQIELTIINDKQKQRSRTLESFSKKDGENRLNLMIVSEPRSLFNTGFLSIDRKKDEPEDAQWIYLSALERTKRIASKDKSGRFLSSDFSYYDMTLLNVDKFTYTLVEETVLNNTSVWKIRATARTDAIAEETGYTESLLWVRKDPYMILQADHQTDNPKRRKLYKVKNYEQKENGIWVITKSLMQVYYKEKLEQQTLFITNTIKFNQNLDAQLFTVRNLEKGL